MARLKTATDLQNLTLVEIVEVVFPLEILLEKQVEEGNPHLAVKFGDLQTVLARNLLPSAVDVLLQRTCRGSQSISGHWLINRRSSEGGKSTLFESFPGATVNQLHQHAGHVVCAQQAVDDTDAVGNDGRHWQLINAIVYTVLV